MSRLDGKLAIESPGTRRGRPLAEIEKAIAGLGKRARESSSRSMNCRAEPSPSPTAASTAR